MSVFLTNCLVQYYIMIIRVEPLSAGYPVQDEGNHGNAEQNKVYHPCDITVTRLFKSFNCFQQIYITKQLAQTSLVKVIYFGSIVQGTSINYSRSGKETLNIWSFSC